MTHSSTVVSRNGQVRHRDPQTRKATGPLLGWVERDPGDRRHWIAQSIAGGRIATEQATRHEALSTLLDHVDEVQTSRMAATVNTGPIRLRTRPSLSTVGHHLGMWIGGLAGLVALGTFIVALTVL